MRSDKRISIILLPVLFLSLLFFIGEGHALLGDNNEISVAEVSASKSCNIDIYGSAGFSTHYDSASEKYFDRVSDDYYNYSASILNDSTGRYVSKSLGWYRWCRNLSLSFTVPSKGLYDIYVSRKTRNYASNSYSTYLNDSLIGSFSHTFNNTYSLMPLNSLASPLNLSAGSQQINISFNDADPNLENTPFGYDYLYLVRRGNASTPNIVDFSYPSLYYHNDFSPLVRANGSLEIMNVSLIFPDFTVELDSFSGSLWDRNASGSVDMLRNLSGNVTVTLNVTDSYGYTRLKNYTLTIGDAPDVVVEGIVFPNFTEKVSGDLASFTMQLYNNGTGNATDYACNLTRLGPDLLVSTGLVNLSAGERKNVTINWVVNSSGRKHKFQVVMGNTTMDRDDNNIYTSSSQRLYLNSFSVTNGLDNMALSIRLYNTDAMNETAFELSASEFYNNDSIEIQNSNPWGIVNITYNLTYLTENSLDVNTLRGTWFNRSSGKSEELNSSHPYVTASGLDTTGGYLWFNWTKWSTEGFGLIATPISSTDNSSSSDESSSSSSSSSDDGDSGSSGGGGYSSGGGGFGVNTTDISGFKTQFKYKTIVVVEDRKYDASEDWEAGKVIYDELRVWGSNTETIELISASEFLSNLAKFEDFNKVLIGGHEGNLLVDELGIYNGRYRFSRDPTDKFWGVCRDDFVYGDVWCQPDKGLVKLYLNDPWSISGRGHVLVVAGTDREATLNTTTRWIEDMREFYADGVMGKNLGTELIL